MSGLMWFKENVRLAALRLAPWALVAPAAVWLSLRFPITGPTWPRRLAVHTVASALALLCLEAPLIFFEPPPFQRSPPAHHAPGDLGTAEPTIAPASAPSPRDSLDPKYRARAPNRAGHHDTGVGPAPAGFPAPPPWFMRGHQSFPLYWCLVAAAHLLYFQRAARRAAVMEAQLSTARLAALQLQLQPHFLFNSLNAISSLVRSDVEAADEMICALGTLLHTTLDKSGRAEVRLTEEVEIAQHYLRIQQVRFGHALHVEIHIEATVALAAIPTLSLQPLLENAVIHGLNGRAGTISLHASRHEDLLVVEVTDEVSDPEAPGGPPKRSSGVGLANIRARLATLHDARASLELKRNPTGATARIEVPFRELLVS